MGEVYRARDPRLGRDVAIKVLPASFSTDADRLRRFEQEARAASALNHPGILTIHDFAQHEGVPYVVSELLEGQNLRERIAGSPLPMRKAIDYAVQMARGLAAAHEKGIVHRDLKPENVFVTRDGRVKILDFGLAKLIRPEFSGTEAPTLGTEPGAILGTIGYMSPEQVRGLPADHRSDIFSFGAILCEMLTGERAFRGDSAVETMSAILKEEPPDLSEGSAKIPPNLARVVRHCLEKDPLDRFQSIRDVAFHLEGLSSVSGPSAAVPTVVPARSTLRRWVPLTLLAMAALALGYVLGTFRKPAAVSSPVGVHRLTDFAGLEEAPAISPDGKSVAFTAYVARQAAGLGEVDLWRLSAPAHARRRRSPGAALGPGRSIADVLLRPRSKGSRKALCGRCRRSAGSPRRIANSIGGADVSHDGKRIAFFRFEKDQIELVVSSRDGASPRVIARFPLAPITFLRGGRPTASRSPIRAVTYSPTTSLPYRPMEGSPGGSPVKEYCCPASAGRPTARESYTARHAGAPFCICRPSIYGWSASTVRGVDS